MPKYWRPSTTLNGAGYFYGRTDSGKTWKMMALAQIYNSALGYKIFDIGAGKRNENSFWCFPSDEDRLWGEYKELVGDMLNDGPKEYNVKLLYPLLYQKLPQKLPQHLPRIKTQAFTIYFKDITTQDISLVTGELSRNAVHMWNKIIKNLPDTANGVDILNYINEDMPTYKSLVIYKLFIKPAVDNMLLCGRDTQTNIDLIKEAKEVDRVSVLNLEYVKEKTWKMFFMGFIMRRLLFELAMKDKIPKKNIAIFREAGDYMKKVDKDLKDGEQTQIFRNLLTNIARYARSGLIPFMDTQSPSDTRNLIEGQDDLLCINEISTLDIKDILDKLRSERRISKKLIDNLYNLAQHEMIIVERKKKAMLIKRVQPPRTMAYKGKSFEIVWKEKINEYKNTKQDIEIVENEYKKSKKKDDKVYEEKEEIVNEEKDEEIIEDDTGGLKI